MTHYTNHTHPSPKCLLLPLCLAVCGLTPFAALLQQGDDRTVDASGLHMERIWNEQKDLPSGYD